MGTPILHKLGQKLVIFRGFSKFFFRTTGFQLKLLMLIESSNIFHWKTGKKNQIGCGLWGNLGQVRSNVVKKVKKRALSIVFFFFHILHGEYPLKQKLVVAKTSEWKFKANIARNATFEGR